MVVVCMYERDRVVFLCHMYCNKRKGLGIKVRVNGKLIAEISELREGISTLLFSIDRALQSSGIRPQERESEATKDTAVATGEDYLLKKQLTQYANGNTELKSGVRVMGMLLYPYQNTPCLFLFALTGLFFLFLK